MSRILSVRITGLPVPQGSKKMVRNRLKNGSLSEPRLVDDNSHKLKAWRKAVATAAKVSLPIGWSPADGPVRVVLLFAMRKPLSAPKRRRTWPTTRPDIDKLARAILDALTTAGVWKDDSQVVSLQVDKDFPGPDVRQTETGVLVEVHRLDHPDAIAAPAPPTQEGLPIP